MSGPPSAWPRRWSPVGLPGLTGEVGILSRYGKPCAKLVPVEEDEGRDTVPLGFVELTMPESFFEPLPEEELAAWESPDR